MSSEDWEKRMSLAIAVYFNGDVILELGKAIKMWMNEWGIYLALGCILLYTQSSLQS